MCAKVTVLISPRRLDCRMLVKKIVGHCRSPRASEDMLFTPIRSHYQMDNSADMHAQKCESKVRFELHTISVFVLHTFGVFLFRTSCTMG